MLSNPHTDPPEEQPATRRQAIKYLERFVRWARKLDDDDLHAVVSFCANVHMAWNDGKAKEADAAKAVAEGSAQMELPGLGGNTDAAN